MKTFINWLFGSKLKVAVLVLFVGVAATTLQGCDDNDNYCNYVICPSVPRPNAIVTVKTAADNTVYLQLDDSTTLLPTNMKEHPFNGKEVRAFVNIREVGDNASPYSKAVIVTHIDSVLTKHTVATLGDKNDEVYGKDPIEIGKGFPTVCEDNYLTLWLGTVWGGRGTSHLVNLVTGTNASDPYELELRQNSYGDTKGAFEYTTVAFSLKDLPKTGGKTVKLKVKYQSFEGEKTAEFNYKTKD